MLSSNFLRHLTRLSLVAASLVGLSARALEQDAPSLALVDQVVQAYGGAAQIERVVAFNADGFINASVRQKGGTYKRWFKRPRMLRVETAYPGSTETRVLNGELAWRYSDSSPMTGVQGPSRLAMVYQYKQLDLPYGLLKGQYNLRHGGTELVGDLSTEVMDVWDDEGPRIRVNVDTQSHYIVKVAGHINFGPQTMVLAVEFSDFKRVDGTPMPFHIRNFAAGMPISESLISRYAINPALDSELFVPRLKGRETTQAAPRVMQLTASSR